MFCSNCAKEMSDQASSCPSCGHPASPGLGALSDKKKVTAILLCLFLGGFGAHRFYVGKTGTGILMILTIGGLGVWSLIDLVRLITGSFKDIEGRELA